MQKKKRNQTERKEKNREQNAKASGDTPETPPNQN